MDLSNGKSILDRVGKEAKLDTCLAGILLFFNCLKSNAITDITVTVIAALSKVIDKLLGQNEA